MRYSNAVASQFAKGHKHVGTGGLELRRSSDHESCALGCALYKNLVIIIIIIIIIIYFFLCFFFL